MIRKAWRILLLNSGAFFFRYRNGLFPVFVIFMALCTKPAGFLGSPRADLAAVILGFIVALAGAAFRMFVIGFAYIKRGGKDGCVYADGLVTEGIYAHVRNPMYLGNIIIIAGIGLIYGSPWVYVILIPFFCFVYLSIIVTEEDYLRCRFDAEFDGYCQRVNRFIPNFSGIGRTAGGLPYDWRKAIRKDYGTFLGALFGCYVTLLLKLYYLYGLKESAYKIPIIAGPPVIILALYGWLRFLKKSGKLTSPGNSGG